MSETRTPLRYLETDRGILLIGAGGQDLGTINHYYRDKSDVELAALIVSAVNERAALVEALREITEHFEAVLTGPIFEAAGVEFPNGVESVPTIAAARAALRAAGREG